MSRSLIKLLDEEGPKVYGEIHGRQLLKPSGELFEIPCRQVGVSGESTRCLFEQPCFPGIINELLAKEAQVSTLAAG